MENVLNLENATLIYGDCVTEISKIADESIGFTVFSPPFAELYTYSDDVRDMGNSQNYDEFAIHYNFLTPQLKRIMQKGRLVAIHCMDIPIQKGKEGFIGLRDFSGFIIKLMTDCGFIYHSRVTIWKDPVVEMQRTKALGLLHKQTKKDFAMCRVGIPDYILLFRNDGENESPIKQDISVDTWQKLASPVWMDINQTNTLNSIKGTNDEKHICPLQLDTIQRLVQLYSNPNDTVFSPFMGIGSEGYQSILMNRKFVGIELKEEYYKQSIVNIKSAMEQTHQLSII